MVPSSPNHVLYQQFMHGVDVMDQACGNYSAQLRRQRWRHNLFMFVVDQSLINCYACDISRGDGSIGSVEALQFWKNTQRLIKVDRIANIIHLQQIWFVDCEQNNPVCVHYKNIHGLMSRFSGGKCLCECL